MIFDRIECKKGYKLPSFPEEKPQVSENNISKEKSTEKTKYNHQNESTKSERLVRTKSTR